MNIKDYLLLFIPALLIVGIGLFVRIIQYQPLFPKEEQKTESPQLATVPIFGDDIITGSKQAPVSIVIFDDVSCSQCKFQSELLDELAKRNPNSFHIIWKMLSVTQFPQSTELAHTYAYCADKQGKFLEFKELAHENSNNVSDTMLQMITEDINVDKKKLVTCLASDEAKSYSERVQLLAKSLGIQAIPAIFVNDNQISSPQTISEWESYLK